MDSLPAEPEAESEGEALSVSSEFIEKSPGIVVALAFRFGLRRRRAKGFLQSKNVPYSGIGRLRIGPKELGSGFRALAAEVIANNAENGREWRRTVGHGPVAPEQKPILAE